ncbi:MAG: hypothetical protein D6806_11195 [Deltaproteobacteria bacterium]|nr:MAG: hypothetical protein D6806_11195 [Deltaproteobacteria bacterium]
MRTAISAVCIALLGITTARVAAQADDGKYCGWQQPSPKVQLEMDAELIPVNRGAVFVPAMTDPAAEPPYVVLDESDQVVARTNTGHKTFLPPGKYTVLVGSGVRSQMLPHEVEVFEGHCTLVEPDWAGLVVRVVDRRGVQFRGSYEIFALPGGEDFGLGLGADEDRGETLRTWLLKPGRYMLVKAGETVRARTDFLTVRLLPGELTNMLLVQDEESGSFLGGGVVDRGEGKTEIKNWRLGLLVGGDFSWNRNDNVVGRPFGNTITVNAFADWSLRYLNPDHLLYLRLQIDEGQTVQPGQDFLAWRQKTNDEVNLDAIYTYRLLSWLGPYVRFGLDTNIFPGWQQFERTLPELEKDIVIFDASGNAISRLSPPPADEDWEIRLADSFDPLELKEGAGASFDLAPWQVLDVHLRVGFGARQYFVRSLLRPRSYSEDDPDTTCLEQTCFEQVSSSKLMGLESTLIGSARLSRWFIIDTELETLIPFWVTTGSTSPAINWKNTISFRIVSFASVAYVVRLDYDKQLSENLQFEQRLMLRFTFDVL